MINNTDPAREAKINPTVLRLLCSDCDGYFTDWHESRCNKCGHRYRPTPENENCPECGDENYNEMCPTCDDGVLTYAEEDKRFVAGYRAGAAREEWVAVEDRLPKSGQQVLCQTREGRFVVNSWAAGCDQNEQWFAERFVVWMPMPKPYGEKDAQ